MDNTLSEFCYKGQQGNRQKLEAKVKSNGFEIEKSADGNEPVEKEK